MQRVLIPHTIADAAPPRGQVHDCNGLSMGTSWSVRVVAGAQFDVQRLQQVLQELLDGVVAEMSHWDNNSVLGRFNLAPAQSWVTLPEDFYQVLSFALQVAADSEGAYDPAAGALVNAWGFGPSSRYDEPGFMPPTARKMCTILAGPRWASLELDRSSRRLFQPGGALLDLSAVAKGFSVDKLAGYLLQQNIQHFLVEVGGELRGAGFKPDGQPWWVRLEQPPAVRSSSDEGVLVALHGLAVATSGDYRRSFLADGRLYPHTIDPRSGVPVTNDVASVTVLHVQCMAADALSTALTVMGAEQGLAFAEARGLAARFLVRRDGALVETMTSKFRGMLQ